VPLPIVAIEVLTRLKTAPETRAFPTAWLVDGVLRDVSAPLDTRPRDGLEAAVSIHLSEPVAVQSLLSIAARAWRSVEGHDPGAPMILTRATRETSTTISSLRRTLHTQARERLVQELPAERRAMYEAIRRLRDEIGPVDFNVADLIRELRENG